MARASSRSGEQTTSRSRPDSGLMLRLPRLPLARARSPNPNSGPLAPGRAASPTRWCRYKGIAGALVSFAARSRAVLQPAQVAAEGADREHQAVQVVVDVEVAGEAGPGELRLIPRAVGALGLRQPRDAPLYAGGLLRGGPLAAGREQRQQGPGGL